MANNPTAAELHNPDTESSKAAIIWRHNWAGISGSNLTHIAVSRRYWFLIGCWPEASVPPKVGLCIGLLTTWQLASPKMSDSRESKQIIKMKAAWYFIA